MLAYKPTSDSQKYPTTLSSSRPESSRRPSSVEPTIAVISASPWTALTNEWSNDVAIRHTACAHNPPPVAIGRTYKQQSQSPSASLSRKRGQHSPNALARRAVNIRNSPFNLSGTGNRQSPTQLLRSSTLAAERHGCHAQRRFLRGSLRGTPT